MSALPKKATSERAPTGRNQKRGERLFCVDSVRDYLNRQMGRRRKMTSAIVKAMCFLSVAQELLGAENFSAAFQDLAQQAVSKALSHLVAGTQGR